jgi:hypothetical protein
VLTNTLPIPEDKRFDSGSIGLDHLRLVGAPTGSTWRILLDCQG